MIGQLERALTIMEKAMLLEIHNHPGLTVQDHAEKFGHLQDVYSAIYYLIFSARVNRDEVTGALTVRDV